MSQPDSPPAASAGTDTPRKAKPIPFIDIKVSWCKGCGLCVEYCKPDVLVMKGTLPEVVAAEKCTRCLQCEAVCPDFAIVVREGAPGGNTP